ncbi:MAG TPA: hypothetical protein ENN54_00100 [Thermoplasmatales archaeon]|nr:hypothetical protein [Thermoplasmatales archaeon]
MFLSAARFQTGGIAILDLLESTIPYISGLYTLPWIAVGFVANILLSRLFGERRVAAVMKKIGLVLLYFFIPVLIFRIFLDTHLGQEQLEFAAVTAAVITFMYLLALAFARYTASRQALQGEQKSLYVRTVLTNQGRSAAFIGSAMVTYWPTEAGMFMALVGIALFAVIPYMLSHLHKKQGAGRAESRQVLPWFLKLYPWYLLLFVIAAVAIHGLTGTTTSSFGDLGIVLKFYTAVTIPAALYYVGSGIHPADLQASELKKLLGLEMDTEEHHWSWVRRIFLLTVVLTPAVITALLAPLLLLGAIPAAWFAVIVINALLPITSTNMFLLPYGIDKKSTAHSITWTTLVCVPLVIALIVVFSTVL